jgi:hypothetical protein
MNECYGTYAQQAILVIPTIREDVPLLEERSSTAGGSLRGAQICVANSLGPITLGTRAQAWSGGAKAPAKKPWGRRGPQPVKR